MTSQLKRTQKGHDVEKLFLDWVGNFNNIYLIQLFLTSTSFKVLLTYCALESIEIRRNMNAFSNNNDNNNNIGKFFSNIFYMFFRAAWIGYTFSVVINLRIWTVWVTVYVFTKEIYRPQRDSSPIHPGSESTHRPGGLKSADRRQRFIDQLYIASSIE